MPAGKGHALTTYRQTTTATSVVMVGENLSRVMLHFKNGDASNSAFVGSTVALSATNGYIVSAGGSLILDNYTGPLWIIHSATASAACSAVEY